MALVQSKEVGGGSLCWRAAAASGAALRCEAHSNCLHVWPELAGAARSQRLPLPSSLLCTRAVRNLRPIEQAYGCSSVRDGCKLFAFRAGTHRGCSPIVAVATFLFALLRSLQRPLINQAGLWLLFGARRMQSVCLSGRHLQGPLASRGCHGRPLCFALEPSATTDQSSRLAAALRCEADAKCLPV